MEIPIKLDDLGGPLFLETPIYALLAFFWVKTQLLRLSDSSPLFETGCQLNHEERLQQFSACHLEKPNNDQLQRVVSMLGPQINGSHFNRKKTSK